MFQRLPQARDHYDRLLKQTGSNAVRNNLAEVLLRLRTRAPWPWPTRPLHAEPNNPNVLDTAGWAHAEAGQLDRALALLRDARLRQPGAANIRYHLAAVLARKGKRTKHSRSCAPRWPARGPSPTARRRSLAGHAPDPLIAAGLA